jgi:hypothetical protein
VGNAVGIDGKTPVAGSFSYTYYASDGVTQLSGTPTNAGSYYVTAAFTSSDPNYGNATSAETSFTIGQAGVSVQATTATIAYSTSAGTLTLIGNVSSSTGAGINAGTLTFTVAGFSPVVSGSVVNGQASASFTLPAGTAPQALAITTAYSGSSNFVAGSNSAGTLTVTKATPVITWANPASITYGGALSKTQLDATASVPGTLVYSPAATTVLPAGIQTLNVTFTPANTTDYATTTASVTIDVLPATLTVTTVSKTKTYGATFSAFSGSVSGLKNGDTIAIAGYGSAGAAATATVSGGPYVISATLTNPNDELANYTVVTHNGNLTVTPAALTITAGNQTKTYGRTLTLGTTDFTASGLLNTDSVTGVTLTSAGASASASVAKSPYNIVPNAATGSGLRNYKINYVSGQLTVTQANSTTTVTSSVNPSVYGQTVTFTANVASTTSGTPTGTVAFYDGTTLLGSGTLGGGKATFKTAALAVGSHSVTAVYSGDGNFVTSTSSPFTQTVNKAPVKIALTSSLNPSPAPGDEVTFTATVTAASPGSGTPTGTVTFMDGSTVLGTVGLVNGIATLNISSLALGNHKITAVYNGDIDFLPLTSSALTETIK